MMNSERPMLDAALSYVKRGWEVFPVPPGTKMGYSVKQRGFNNNEPWGKTKIEAEVREYWRRLPRANVGVAMGVDSGIFDLEVDTRLGHSSLRQDGAVSLAAIETQHAKLPDTLMFESPSGSVHRLFKHPGGDFRVEHSTSTLGEGIDVIGDGYMSVVPPSVKPGKGAYRWINDLAVADAPAWLLDLVRKEKTEPRHRASDAELPSRDTVELCLALLPNDDPSYDFWKDVGMAIWASTAGEGLDLFHAWSRKWHGYDANDTDLAWRQIESAPPERYGPRAIINKLEEAMPDWEYCLFGDKEVDAQIDAFLKLLGEDT
jgi:Bifunctional DNA primase/polymerase, N-terminal/Primase C terminal 2 (PriCT-2)